MAEEKKTEYSMRELEQITTVDRAYLAQELDRINKKIELVETRCEQLLKLQIAAEEPIG